MSLRFAILGSLAKAPASGYDLLKRFDRKLNFVWWASQGAVYTELQRLGREGLLAGDEEEGGRGRTEHRVTEAGRAELRAWLTTTPARRPRDELILRIFSLWALPRDEAAAFLDDLAEQYRSRLAEYRRRRDSWDGEPEDDADFFDRIALEAGLAHEEALLGWAERSAAQVRARS